MAVTAVEEGEEDADVFEAGIHALPVEGHHGVRGVAEDDDGGGVVVGLAFDGYEGEVWVIVELSLELFRGDEVGGYAWKVGLEEFG